MRLRIALLPAVVVTLASVGLLAVPSANASTAAKKTPTITCKKFTGNLEGGNGTLSGCSDKANTGGSGTFPPSSIEQSSGTITWNQTGTTDVDNFIGNGVSPSACKHSNPEDKVTGDVFGGTGAAATSIPDGDTLTVYLCINPSTGEVTLAPKTKFTIAPPTVSG
jgi:hypothetical protein